MAIWIFYGWMYQQALGLIGGQKSKDSKTSLDQAIVLSLCFSTIVLQGWWGELSTKACAMMQGGAGTRRGNRAEGRRQSKWWPTAHPSYPCGRYPTAHPSYPNVFWTVRIWKGFQALQNIQNTLFKSEPSKTLGCAARYHVVVPYRYPRISHHEDICYGSIGDQVKLGLTTLISPTAMPCCMFCVWANIINVL